MIRSTALFLPVLMLAACSGEQPADEAAPAEAPAETQAPAGTDAGEDMANETAEDTLPIDSLEYAIAGEWRGEAAARDVWRHPVETLNFFGVEPSSTVIEIWPGGGWYADILAPWIAANGGTYVAAHFDAESPSEYRVRSRENFTARMADTGLYGEVEIVDFGHDSGPIVEAGTADAVLTFRNVHNWLIDGWGEKAFADFYDALRPGGVLGVVDHRLPSTAEQDPRARTGYVQEAYVIALAEEAGFELVGSSEINANPADTADHPFGVWTLPPSRRSPGDDDPAAADFDRAAYDAIGESDRMTLLFRKPVEED